MISPGVAMGEERAPRVRREGRRSVRRIVVVVVVGSFWFGVWCGGCGLDVVLAK